MTDWVHCNTCFCVPGTGARFALTSCGHIFCNDCLENGLPDGCKMCGCKCNIIPLSAKMKPDVEIFFTDPLSIIKKQQKQLIQVIEFQQGHRQRLFKQLREKLKNSESKLQHVNQLVQRCSELEKENIVLREEHAYMKKLLNSMAGPGGNRGGHSGRSYSPMSQSTRSASPMGRNENSENLNKQGSMVSQLQRAVQRGRSPYVVDGQQNLTPSCRSGRITLRTPPSNGRMGTIPGPPASEGQLRSQSPMVSSPITPSYGLGQGPLSTSATCPITPNAHSSLHLFVTPSRPQSTQTNTMSTSQSKKPIQLQFSSTSGL